jgi:hypothetical protein
MNIDTQLIVRFDLNADERFIADDPWPRGDRIEVSTIEVDLCRDPADAVHAEGAKVRKDGKGIKGAGWHLAVLTPEQDAHWFKLAQEHWAAVQRDRHLGNKIAREGCDRCSCGCKYWENDRCIDCGTHVSQIPQENQ